MGQKDWAAGSVQWVPEKPVLTSRQYYSSFCCISVATHRSNREPRKKLVFAREQVATSNFSIGCASRDGGIKEVGN